MIIIVNIRYGTECWYILRFEPRAGIKGNQSL